MSLAADLFRVQGQPRAYVSPVAQSSVGAVRPKKLSGCCEAKTLPRRAQRAQTDQHEAHTVTIERREQRSFSVGKDRKDALVRPSINF
jgi:hypothetical protein